MATNGEGVAVWTAARKRMLGFAGVGIQPLIKQIGCGVFICGHQ
jgi:hypothetical protein